MTYQQAIASDTRQISVADYRQFGAQGYVVIRG